MLAEDRERERPGREQRYSGQPLPSLADEFRNFRKSDWTQGSRTDMPYKSFNSPYLNQA